FWMAAEQNNTSLALYLDKSITDPAFKASTQRFWKIHKDPGLLASTRFNGQLEHQRTIMIHGIKRLASKDLDLAVNTWLQLRDSHPFSLKQRSMIDQRLAMKAAKNFVDNAETLIARLDPDFQYHKVTEWRIRLALAEQNWDNVLTLIARLPKSFQNHSRWRYWGEVAQLKYQEENNPVGAIPFSKKPTLLKTPTLRALSKERNFYAFLVADLKGQSFQLNHQQKAIRLQDLQKLKQYYPGFKRIREWIYHERFYNAQSELNRITPNLDNTQKKLIPYLAQQWEWHHQAIMSAARAALWDDLDLRFPAPESDIFSKYAKKRDLDYPWVLAIARQESAFNPRARSHSGAMGLMQLMPATAKQAARKAGIPYRKKSELYKPEINIALGTTHLAWLSKRFENSLILATAAYNAGSTPVNRWLKQRGHLPLDIWIETIPYDETRNYVQSVMAFRVIYSQRQPELKREPAQKRKPARMFSPQEVASLSLNQQEPPVIAQREQSKP
nr:transglycosylase SLT domain-containing protein [Endozoicomonas sp.]